MVFARFIDAEIRDALASTTHLLISPSPRRTAWASKHRAARRSIPVLEAFASDIRERMPRLEWIGYWVDRRRLWRPWRGVGG